MSAFTTYLLTHSSARDERKNVIFHIDDYPSKDVALAAREEAQRQLEEPVRCCLLTQPVWKEKGQTWMCIEQRDDDHFDMLHVPKKVLFSAGLTGMQLARAYLVAAGKHAEIRDRPFDRRLGGVADGKGEAK